MDIENQYQLEECSEWIVDNRFKNVALQFNLVDLANSARVVAILEDLIVVNYKSRLTNTKCIEEDSDKDILPRLYITQPTTCCADLIITQHVTGLDAVIHFGTVCLTQPMVKSQMNLPILYIFGNKFDTSILDDIKLRLDEALEGEFDSDTLVLYETSLLNYINGISTLESFKELSFAKLIKECDSWHFSKMSQNWIIDLSHQNKDNEGLHRVCHFSTDKSIKTFKRVVHLGHCRSLLLKISNPNQFIEITLESRTNNVINPSRLLSKRIALVERLKNDEELRVGIIITNPIPDIGNTLTTFKNLAKRRKHILYFITMIQTIDECKIGNFDLCDAFVVVNSCFCSTILEALHFNRPLLNEWEFRLACGLGLEYGGIMWPTCYMDQDDDNLLSSEEQHDRLLKRKVSDVSLSLMQTRNELLEKCCRMEKINSNRWFGLKYKPDLSHEDDSPCDLKESTEIKEGLIGIASHYSQEPSNTIEKSSSR